MDNISILIGGKAGFGIDKSGLIIAGCLNRLGYRIYVYRDYPSIIRGGHTFSIIRASKKKVATHLDKVDFILALDQNTVDHHKDKVKDGTVIIYDSDSVVPESVVSAKKAIALSLLKITKEENAPEIMRNSGIIAGLFKAIGIEWSMLEASFKKNMPKELDLNLKIASKCYGLTETILKLDPTGQAKLPLFTGNEAISLGLIQAGLDAYVAYPMTPSSPILHFLASAAKDVGLKVIHPENEIAVIMMALGFAYCGRKAAVGTSGGGFCLMTEGLSFAAMAELPITIILGQRPGPSTGLPTYSCQTELHFALNAGQGEFPRFIVAPGDPEDAFFWSQVALNISWKYQLPSIILSDKDMGEGTYSFDISSVKTLKEEEPLLWDRKGEYKRYRNTDTGVSPLALAPDKDAIIKINSYEHDEFGITTEDPATTTAMQDKRMRKEALVAKDVEGYGPVRVYGDKRSPVALLCWGSTKGVCIEAAEELGFRVVQPLVLSPFPLDAYKAAVAGAKKIIAVENNAAAQLAKLLSMHGLSIDHKILKYDGRPFHLEELKEKLGGVLK